MKALRLFSMAALALAFAACNKEIEKKEIIIEEPAQVGIPFTATIGAPATKTVITEGTGDDAGKLLVVWKVGDEVALVHNSVVDVATVTAVDGSGNATIDATITGSPSDNDDVALVYPADAVASATPSSPFPFTPASACWDKVKGQDGTLEFIQNNIDFRIGSGKLSVSGDPATASLKASVSMPSFICIWKLTLQDDAATPNSLAATSLAVSSNSAIQAAATSTAKSVYYLGVVPSLFPSGKLVISTAVGSDSYTYTKDAGITLTAGKYYQSTVTMTKEFSGGTGAVGDPYLISSTDDWNALATAVTNGKTYNGKYFKQTANISATTMAGSDSKAFSGNYDGDGKTLDVTLSGSGNYTAPFVYISGATIKNLKITGTISTTGMRPASIASYAEVSTITNCWSTVAISSSHNADIDAGAFVARVNKNKSLLLNGCVFTGSMTYSDASGYEGGGMIGWTQSGVTATLNSCVFAPSSISVPTDASDKSRVFVSGNVTGTRNNCYLNTAAYNSNLKKDSYRMRKISAGTGVTSLALSGEGTEYNVSSITACTKGIKYNGVYYAGKDEVVSLILSHADAPAGKTFAGYSATNGTLANPTTNTPTLTLTGGDVTITATYE
jgi:hypothetical protein